MLTRQGTTRLFEAEFNRLTNIDINYSDRSTLFPVVYRPKELIMAEKTVATLLSKTLEQTPIYSGKADQDADEWLKDLTATFRMADITEPQALKIIPIFLEGPAKEWFIENITVFESWSPFKAEFLHTYSSPTSKQLASNRSRTRQQRCDETVIEYYTDVMKLCRLVDPNMPDACKLDHLYHGLKSSLMKEVLRQAPSTPSTFLEQARREENLNRLVTASLPPTADNDPLAINYFNTSLYRPTQPAESMHYPKSPNPYFHRYSANVYPPLPSHIRFHYQPPSQYLSQDQHSSINASRYHPRPIRCYLCHKLGHFVRDCRSEKSY